MNPAVLGGKGAFSHACSTQDTRNGSEMGKPQIVAASAGPVWT